MSTASMTTARWREYSIAVWIILTVITGLVLWYSWPFMKMVGTLIQLVWVVVTGEWNLIKEHPHAGTGTLDGVGLPIAS